MAQRLMGGAAALMAAVMKMAAVFRVSSTPMADSTEPTRAPTVRTLVAPDPVRAPGISITNVKSSRQITRRA